MSSIKFNPQIFRIVTEGAHGKSVWDLLTIDGENPRDTVYFMLNGDAPHLQESRKIDELIEKEEWEVYSLTELNKSIGDFSIDKSIFETAGSGYEEIRNELKNF